MMENHTSSPLSKGTAIETATTSPLEWLNEPLEMFQQNHGYSNWPWMNIPNDAWTTALDPMLRFQEGLRNSEQAILLAIVPMGLIGSACSVASVWKKSMHEKERFYSWMLIIAVLDLLFNVLYVPSLLGFGQLFPSIYRFSWSGTKARCVLDGLIYGVSLASDMCTLVLTIERYLILCKFDSIHHHQADQSSLIRSILSTSIIASMSVIRFIRYGFSIEPSEKFDVESGQSIYWLVDSQLVGTDWFAALILISDVILPFLLLISMLYLATRIALVIGKRPKARVHSNASIGQQIEMRKQATAMLRLLTILVALFISNQLCYCIYAMSNILIKRAAVGFSFDASLEKVIGVIKVGLFGDVALLMSFAVEALSRSINFYLYYCFSGSTREEFRKVCRCSGGCAGGCA